MKQRRDITLGEMQDECSFRGHNCETIGGEPCKHYAICNQIRTKSCTPPEDWDLSDPPRFTEAQMAFWKSLYDLGAREIVPIFNEDDSCSGWQTNDMNTISWSCITIPQELSETIGLELGETLDLAELLGKDGAET